MVRECLWHQSAPPKRSAGRLDRQPVEPELQKERWKDRSIRGARKSVGPTGLERSLRCLELASRKTILASGSPNRTNRPDIWMQAI